MIVSLPVVVLSCDDPPCGACCTEQAGLPVSWYLGAIPLGNPAALPTNVRTELERLLARFKRDGFLPDGSPCVWYDTSARRCRHYEHRPDVCREFEPGSEACVMWRKARGVADSSG